MHRQIDCHSWQIENQRNKHETIKEEKLAIEGNPFLTAKYRYGEADNFPCVIYTFADNKDLKDITVDQYDNGADTLILHKLFGELEFEISVNEEHTFIRIEKYCTGIPYRKDQMYFIYTGAPLC